MSTAKNRTIIGLDVGDVRIGVARATIGSFFPVPCDVVTNDARVYDRLSAIFDSESAAAVVVGLPRNLNSEDTQQTTHIRDFAKQLQGSTTLPVYFQDEAGTTKKAKEELRRHKKPQKGPAGSVDALAATYILEDFLEQEAHRELFT